MTVAEQKYRKFRDACQAMSAAGDEYMRYVERHPTGHACDHDDIAIIQRVVCDHFRLHGSVMSTKTRTDEYAHPRQIAMALAKELTKVNYTDIGRCFGGREHGTVIHGIRAISDRCEVDAKFRAQVEALRVRCRSAIENQDTPLFEERSGT